MLNIIPTGSATGADGKQYHGNHLSAAFQFPFRHRCCVGFWCAAVNYEFSGILTCCTDYLDRQPVKTRFSLSSATGKHQLKNKMCMTKSLGLLSYS